MSDLEWAPQDRWRSNHGAGPLEARMVSVEGGFATLEYRRIGGRKWRRFHLSVEYLTSVRCGWKRVESKKENAA